MTISPEIPDCGVYLVWPTEGTDWIHPDDIDVVNRLIPSNRVWNRTEFDGEYYHLSYGDVRIRVRPSLWHRVEDEGLRIGDQVQVLAHNMDNDPFVGHVSEIRWDTNNKRIHYELQQRDQTIPHAYVSSDLMRLTLHCHLREADANSVPKPKQIDVPGMERLSVDLQ